MRIDIQDAVENFKIFLDSSALLSSDYEAFWEDMSNELIKQRKTVLIPLKAFMEVRKEGSQKSKEIIAELERLYNLNLIEFIGSQSDIEDENIYSTTFKSLSEKHSVIFITQNLSQACQIYAATENSNYPVGLCYFKDNQILSYENLKEVADSTSGTVNSLVLGPFKRLEKKAKELLKRNTLPENECFALSQTITDVPDTVIPVTSLPEEGDTVLSSNGEVKLLKELATGGEGKIYETDTGLIAKVYKKERITKRRSEKIRLMLSKDINCPGVCYPVEIIYNQNHEFIGYLMPKAHGIELQKSVFVKKLFKKRFPNWTKADTVTLAVTILEKIIYLNSRGIIMGDINPMNILVVSPTEVYFVDTDSYQIEDFPCPVGTVNFTAPEIQGVTFSQFLRTPAHEHFAIATLMFMLMLPGKAPYAQRGGEGPQQNILNMDFSYPYLNFSNGKTPKGPWAAMWSHLPDAVQEAFFCSFRKGECFCSPAKRLKGEDWLTLFKEYQTLLVSTPWPKMDTEALELFPKGFRESDPSHPRKFASPKKKQKKKEKLTACSQCGKGFRKEELTSGLCPDCLKKEEQKRLDDLRRQATLNRGIFGFGKRKTRTTRFNNSQNAASSSSSNTNSNVKTLICRKCRRTFPDYEMKAGLCPDCRAKNPQSVPKSTFAKKQEEKELICRHCHGTFKAKEMQGGLCPDCRKKLGIKDRVRPTVTVSNEKGNKSSTSRGNYSSPKQSNKTLICRKCHKTFPDTAMKNGLCPTCRGQAYNPADYVNSSSGNVKELICRGCHKTFPDYQMKGGLCPSCRGAQQQNTNTQRRRGRNDPYTRSQDRMVRCSSCGISYPASELVKGLCVDCRNKQRASQPSAFGSKTANNKTRSAGNTQSNSHGFNGNKGNSRRYYSGNASSSNSSSQKAKWTGSGHKANNTPPSPEELKETAEKIGQGLNLIDNLFNLTNKTESPPKEKKTTHNNTETKRRETAKEAINGFFKDTPVEALNDLVSWLIDDNK